MSGVLRNLYFALIALFLALPLIVVAGVSVNAKQTLAFPPQGFSLGWYGEIFLNPEWRNALFASVTLALLSAALACAIALPLAWFLWRRIAPWCCISRSPPSTRCWRSVRPTIAAELRLTQM